ncbi:DUF3263 domain-containing protein [Kocuria sp.]|uniref:DUF3263 domain-containing protein n=1 Tax=Kocuria sp. TaxID=1871328 RepID=UPI0026DF2664|nr:DUF3263 domain-containing protein [Kocuria sp.]MDO5619534.1 DUF3263 domain-containing protein [Kocuria sp.]
MTAAASSVPGELGPLERAILDMESRRFKYQGAKERAIRAEIQLPVTAYYQQLNQLIDTPAAWAAQPALMRRLRDHRDGAAL